MKQTDSLFAAALFYEVTYRVLTTVYRDYVMERGSGQERSLINKR